MKKKKGEAAEKSLRNNGNKHFIENMQYFLLEMAMTDVRLCVNQIVDIHLHIHIG
uniref:hypothetical protein n=1 Tax=Agathobacter sp. TaxID=2021311 RepID=UPI004056E9A3